MLVVYLADDLVAELTEMNVVAGGIKLATMDLALEPKVCRQVVRAVHRGAAFEEVRHPGYKAVLL